MRKLITAGLFLALSASAFAQISSNGPVIADYGKHIAAEDPVEAKIAKEVRHELLMLPWYSLFDDLEFTVQGRTVTLSGYVTGSHAATKSDAENVVKHIEGVDKVINNIKILPPSPLDDQVREQTYAALSRTASVSRYFWEAAPVSTSSWKISASRFAASSIAKATRTWLPSPPIVCPVYSK